MKDAFKKALKVNDKVLYSVRGGGGTVYYVGEVVKLHPHKNNDQPYSPPDRVEVEVTRSSDKSTFSKNPIVYASNVIVLPLKE